MSLFCQSARSYTARKAVTCLLIAFLIAWTGCSSKPDQPADGNTEKPAETKDSTGKKDAMPRHEPIEIPAKKPAPDESRPASPDPSASGQLEPVRPPSQAGDAGKEAVPSKEAKSEAMQVLEAMAKAYWDAKSYQDAGYARLYVDLGDKPTDQKIDASVTFERPNRLRAHVGPTMVVADDSTFWAASQELPGQVVRIPAPKRLTVPFLLADPTMLKMLGQGPTGLPPQLALLMQKDALNGLLAENTGVAMLPPEKIDEANCRRVEIARPDGKMVLWIDAASNILRRVELPTEGLRRIIEQGGPVKNVSLTMELVGAKLNGAIDPLAFQFEAPKDSQFVTCFEAPHPLGLLGKPVPDMAFTALDGKPFPVTPADCSGKVTVLFCWATWCEPCKKAFPKIEKAYANLKNDSNVRFVGVSVDDPKTAASAVQEKVASLGATFPVVRDENNVVIDALLTTSIPTLVIIGPKGNVQYYQNGIPEKVVPELMSKVGALLGGKNIYTEARDHYESQMKLLVERVAAARVAAVDQIEAPKPELTRAKIAPRTQPANFTLKTLWRSNTLKNPGNVIVTHLGDGPPRIFTIDGWKGLAEFSEGGEVVKRIPFDIPKAGVVGILHEYAAPSGEKYFVGTAGNQRQCYVFDSDWKTVAAYPKDGLTQPGAPSISDARLLGTRDSKTPTLCMGYWERPSVDAVTLGGKPLWQAAAPHPVMNLASLEPEAASLLGATRGGEAILVEAGGKIAGSVRLKGFSFQWVVAGDLNLDGRMEFAAIAAERTGKIEVIGFSLDGRLLWQHPLPDGVLTQPIDPILVGKLEPQGQDCWVVPGADGSLRFIGVDGTKLDEFNTGVELAGFAATAINGKTVFIISSPQGVEAMTISQ